MKHFLCLVGLAACVDTPPLHEPTVESSHVELLSWPASTVPKLDLMVVIDDSIEMAPYRDRLAALPELIATQIPAARRGWIDLRVAVTSNDGWMRRLPGVEDSFVADRFDYDYTRHTNYPGTLVDALTTLTDVGAAREGTSQPLEAMRHALETNAQFWRDDVALAIVIIAATDDASPLAVSEYARWMRALRGTSGWSPRPVVTSFVVPAAAPRLEELVKSLDWHSDVISIESASYADVLDRLNSWWHFGVPCLEATPVDRDPFTAGTQYDCAMAATIGDEQRTIGELVAGEAISQTNDSELTIVEPSPPGWALVPDRQNCWYSSGLSLALSGYTYFAHPELRFECRTR